MRSPRTPFGWLLRQEWRELLSSRSWWLMLAATGPLVGVVFIQAVRTYAEISEGAGAGCGAVCDPLVGIWGPTFGAFEIVSMFLLPFVVIRLVGGDRQSGALKLMLQQPMPALVRIGAKAIVLGVAWIGVQFAALVAIGLWKSYGGAVSPVEILVVSAGHALDAALTIALAAAMAAIAEHPSTAAILTLGVTVGTWIVQFAAAIHGGFWDRLARVTPSAMVGAFQHGLVPLSTTVSALVLTASGLVVATIWLRLGTTIRRRTIETAAVLAVAATLIAATAPVETAWDLSAGRLNSFSEADERALKRIADPIRVDVHLAAEDPRRIDLDRRALAKLRRAAGDVSVSYLARTSTGLFEQNDSSYGEIRYSVGGRTVTTRITTDEGVLEAVFEAAGIQPDETVDEQFAGQPLIASPAGAALVFYGIWPAAIGAAALFTARRRMRRPPREVSGG